MPVSGGATNSITIDVSSSTADKIVNMTATSTASNANSSSDTKEVTIGNPVTQQVVEERERVVGGGGGAGPSEEKKVFDYEIEIVREDEIGKFNITIEPPYTGSSLKDVSLSLYGYPEQYVDISPESFSNISKPNGRVSEITLSAPEYSDYEVHELEAVIKGTLILKNGDEMPYTETRNIRLIIQTVSKEEANEKMTEAEEAIEKMKELGFNTDELEGYMESSNRSLDNKRNSQSYTFSEEILKTKEKALMTFDLINRVVSAELNPRQHRLLFEEKEAVDFSQEDISNAEGLINQFMQNSKVSSQVVRDSLRLAMAAFERGDYDLAMQRAETARQYLISERKGNLQFFFFLNWHYVLGGLALVSGGGIYGFKRYKKARLSRRIRSLLSEEDSHREYMKKLNRKMAKKEINRDKFNKEKERSRKKIADIKEKVRKLRNQRLRLFRPSKISQDLDSELKETQSKIRQLQKDYYVKQEIPESEYKFSFDELQKRLASIEEERLGLHLKNSGKEGKVKLNGRKK